MAASKGTLNKRERAALERAWDILSDYAEAIEDEAMDEEMEGVSELWDRYNDAMNACCGLCDLLRGHEW